MDRRSTFSTVISSPLGFWRDLYTAAAVINRNAPINTYSSVLFRFGDAVVIFFVAIVIMRCLQTDYVEENGWKSGFFVPDSVPLICYKIAINTMQDYGGFDRNEKILG
jgi:hypothetical protein